MMGLQERHPSMVLPGAESVGIITIEDVLEELLQQVMPTPASPHCADLDPQA